MQRDGDRRSAFAEIGAAGRMLVQPVELHGRTDAYLVIESADALNPAQRTAVSTALALLTLERDRARVERDAARRIRAGAVSLLLQGDAVAAEAVLGELPWASARVVRARGADVAEALATLEHLGAIATVTPDDELIVIAADEPDLPGLLVGVGPVQSLAALGVSDNAARDALAATSPGRPVVRWEELAGEGVDALLAPDSLASYAAMLLASVLSRPDAAELLAALRSFLKHNGQIGPAASELGVHRNTMRNRLALAEDLLGRSLHDPQARADLWIALKHVLTPRWLRGRAHPLVEGSRSDRLETTRRAKPVSRRFRGSEIAQPAGRRDPSTSSRAHAAGEELGELLPRRERQHVRDVLVRADDHQASGPVDAALVEDVASLRVHRVDLLVVDQPERPDARQEDRRHPAELNVLVALLEDHLDVEHAVHDRCPPG